VFGEAGHTETDGKRLSLRRIEEAARCIDEVFLGSPQYEAEAVGDELGLRLVCKVERMRRLGAEVRLEGEDFDEAKAAARALAESEGSRFVEDGREAEIAEGAPAMALSLQEGVRKTTEKVDTIADGIAVRIPVEEALSDLSGVVDDVLLVDDGTIVRAMRLLLFWKMGLVVEPAGAAGVAALLSNRERFAGALVATPLCGSNLTDEQVHQWLLDARSGEEE
jgi:threonine dehydratase